MGRHDDEDVVAAMIVMLFIGVFVALGWILKILISWISDVHQRAPGHPGLAGSWITLLLASSTTLLLALGGWYTAAEWAGGLGFGLFLVILAVVDATSRGPRQRADEPEYSVEETLANPWWLDDEQRVLGGTTADRSSPARSSSSDRRRRKDRV